MALHAREELAGPSLDELLTLDDTSFRALFRKSPIKRIGVNRFLRNVLVACGNSGNTALIPQVKTFLNHENPVLQEMAQWALAEPK